MSDGLSNGMSDALRTIIRDVYQSTGQDVPRTARRLRDSAFDDVGGQYVTDDRVRSVIGPGTQDSRRVTKDEDGDRDRQFQNAIRKLRANGLKSRADEGLAIRSAS